MLRNTSLGLACLHERQHFSKYRKLKDPSVLQKVAAEEKNIKWLREGNLNSRNAFLNVTEFKDEKDFSFLVQISI